MTPRELERVLPALGYISVRQEKVIEVFRTFDDRVPFACFSIDRLTSTSRDEVLRFLARRAEGHACGEQEEA